MGDMIIHLSCEISPHARTSRNRQHSKLQVPMRAHIYRTKSEPSSIWQLARKIHEEAVRVA